nr:flippase [Robertkochia sediminum]
MLVVRVLLLIFSFVVSIMLGRYLGPSGLGVINLVERIISLAIIIVLFGSSQYLIKEVAIAKGKKQWQKIYNILHSSLLYLFIGSLICALCLLIGSEYIATGLFDENKMQIPLCIASLSVVFQVVNRIYSSALNGFDKIWQSSFFNELITTFLVLCIISCFVFFQLDLTIVNVSIFYLFSRLIAMLSSWFVWKKVFPFRFNSSRIKFKSLFKSSFPFLLVSATGFVGANIDALMVGILSTSTQVGLYSVCVRVALVSTILLQIVNTTLAPRFAAFYYEEKYSELNSLIKKISIGLVITSVGPLLIFILMGEGILEFWGDGFRSAYWILVTLALGQMFQVLGNTSGLMLVMCGYEKIQAKLSFSSILLNLSINYFLISNYGALGAAIATSIVFFLENILKVYFAKRFTGIVTLPFLK